MKIAWTVTVDVGTPTERSWSDCATADEKDGVDKPLRTQLAILIGMMVREKIEQEIDCVRKHNSEGVLEYVSPS